MEGESAGAETKEITELHASWERGFGVAVTVLRLSLTLDSAQIRGTGENRTSEEMQFVAGSTLGLEVSESLAGAKLVSSVSPGRPGLWEREPPDSPCRPEPQNPQRSRVCSPEPLISRVCSGRVRSDRLLFGRHK
ncbi:hypothetical protein TREES_T100001618 [Tupaia chinensis]|uniref:Uncharacterized protein n=1 Tax=Tupaia chinensis TaxID=246437 RepID=L9KKI3_TUPCH|nr:hypothetical protein TREES_T100001618 [Tupaia chinensis]